MKRIAAVALVLTIGAALALLPMTAWAAGNADPATTASPQTLCYNYATGSYYVCSYAYSWPYGSSSLGYSPYYGYSNAAYYYGAANPYYTGYYYNPTYYGTYTPYSYAGVSTPSSYYNGNYVGYYAPSYSSGYSNGNSSGYSNGNYAPSYSSGYYYPGYSGYYYPGYSNWYDWNR